MTISTVMTRKYNGKMNKALKSVQGDLESLPNILQRNYALLQDLDKSLQEIQRQNERCEQEIEDYKRGVRSGVITPDSSLVRFSDEALDEQKHAIKIADEKVALAVQAYDLRNWGQGFLRSTQHHLLFPLRICSFCQDIGTRNDEGIKWAKRKYIKSQQEI